MWIPVKIPRTTKPPMGTPIDWGNPLAQGLVGAWPFNEGSGSPFDATINRPAQLFEGTWGVRGVRFNTSQRLNTGQTLAVIDKLSVFALCRTPATLSASRRVCSNFNGTNYSFLLGLNSSGPFQFRWLVHTTTGTQTVLTTSAPNINTDYSVTGVLTGSTQDLYINGMINNSLVKTGNILNQGNSIYIGSDSTGAGGAVSWNSTIDLQMIFNRDLSPTEIASLSANPWQIYMPEVRWINLASGEGISITGVLAQLQAIQTQSIAQALAAISGIIGTVQASQIAALSGGLIFGGISGQTQTKQAATLAAVLSYAGSTTQAQAIQAETLAGLLEFGGTLNQSQAIQVATLTVILAFNGSVAQTQAKQIQLVTDYVARLRSTLTITARDPLALTITAQG